MDEINFRYLDSLSKKEIKSIDDLLSDERLLNYLWIELIFNSDLVDIIINYISFPKIKQSLEDAISWYFAFRWIFPENKKLEELKRNNLVLPHRVKFKEYKEKKRNFIKGLMYAGLC